VITLITVMLLRIGDISSSPWQVARQVVPSSKKEQQSEILCLSQE